MPRTAKSKSLSDTDLVILNAAAARDNGNLIPWPKSLKAKGDDLASVVAGLLERGLITETPAAKKSLGWRQDADGAPIGLHITPRGAKALERGPAVADRTAVRTRAVRGSTKSAALVALLKRKQGVSIAEMMLATGWQAHSVRGFMAGTLKTKLGHTATSTKTKAGERRYHVA